MFKKLISLSLTAAAILGSLGTFSYAQQAPRLEADVPSVITEGFEAYCSGKTENPFPIWAEHTIPAVRDIMTSTKMTEVTNQLFKGMLGKCIGYSVIGSTQLSERTLIVYVESDHENSPMFWQFTVYRSPDGWVISSFDSNTDASKIIPPDIMIGG
jgi:hypothetical protein